MVNPLQSPSMCTWKLKEIGLMMAMQILDNLVRIALLMPFNAQNHGGFLCCAGQ
jgi:hypothetical protein